MGRYAIRLPDVGEGVTEAELGEWQVAVGDRVREDQVLAVVMTDKAAVEIPSPVAGKVLWLAAEAGDTLAVGATLVRLEVDGAGNLDDEDSGEDDSEDHDDGGTGDSTGNSGGNVSAAPRAAAAVTAPRAENEKPLASPAVRRRARDAGIDLRYLAGSGPAGRIVHDDLDEYLRRGGADPRQEPAPGAGVRPNTEIEEIKLIGLRRRIAERMTEAAHIPQITYVDEIDVSALESLRATLNAEAEANTPRLTLLPFLMRALVLAIARQPLLNAHYDAGAGLIRRFGGVHIGIAVQTANGLLVPVVRHAEARDLYGCAAEAARLAEAARAGAASRDELGGSTITISSLGALGGIVSTPLLNPPEVAIVGVNKIRTCPVWDQSSAGFTPRQLMNLSSSFDHRLVDGWDAATFIQTLKRLLETPARLFIDPP